MKYLLLFVVLLLCAGSSNGQLNVWRWQNPQPQGDVLHAVQMISLNVTYACGENGTFMRTSDGGVTWDIQTNLLKLKTVFNSLSFIDQNYGMICGDSGHVLKTTDGGSSWQLLDTNSQIKLNSIVVIDKNTAIIVTMGGGIMRTTDGGNTWLNEPIEGKFALYSINKLRSDFLTIAGYNGTLLKSVDTGRTWLHIVLPFANTFFSVRFSDDMTGTVIGDFGLILHTTNGGVTWIQQQVKNNQIVTANLNVVDGKDPNIFAIAADHGTLLYTTDGGTNWQESYIGTLDAVKGLSFFDKQVATAVGKDGIILRTSDGGMTWAYQPRQPNTDQLRSVAFPKGDTSLGIAVGDQGTILRTTNGGKEWAVMESGLTQTLRCVCFMDSMSVITVGDHGTILRSTDAGLTWNPLVSSTKQHLHSVSFATPNEGLVVGDSNTVLKTYSAGEFWTREFIMPPSRLPWLLPLDFFNSVSYPDKSHAFITSFHYYYISGDGGINWKFKVFDPLDTEVQVYNFGRDTGVLPVNILYGLSFSDSLHGAVLRSFNPGVPIAVWSAEFTSDGGNTMHSIRTPDKTYLNAIQCIDTKHATIVGRGGYIGHTSDGGLTVNQQQSNTLNDLYGVCFGTIHSGNAVGVRGNILRMTTDEVNSSVNGQGASGSPKIIFDGNYPNPFSSFTTISYHLASSGFTTIEIFSVGGERIAELTNNYESSGEHTIRFDAAGLASGTYLCQIRCGGMSAVGKINIEN